MSEQLTACRDWLRQRTGDRAELGELFCATALCGAVTDAERRTARTSFAAMHHGSIHRATDCRWHPSTSNTGPAEYADLVTFFVLSGESGTPNVRLALDGLLLRTVRDNNLTLGAALLRAAVLAGGNQRVTTRRAIELLRGCAEPDGGFGSRWHNPAPETDAIRVPVTLNCAWTLAELYHPGISARLLGTSSH